jgi:hypothetical protein
MSKTLALQELAIVITAKNYDPNLLNPSFLQSSGIITEEWELARQPIVDRRGSQVVFTNGIYLAAQPNRLTFVEPISDNSLSEIQIANLANKYVEVLRNLEYQAVGINFRGYVNCQQNEQPSNNYLSEKFLLPGAWQNCGTEPVKAGLNFLFTYEQKKLYLSVNEAGLKLADSSPLPIILLGGNFDYEINSADLESKLSQLKSIINNWQQDLDIYKEVVSKMSANWEEEVESDNKKVVIAYFLRDKSSNIKLKS